MSVTPFTPITSVKPTFEKPEVKVQPSARIASPMETIKAEKLDTELKGAGKDKADVLNEEARRIAQGQQGANDAPIPSVDREGNKRGTYVSIKA